MKNQYFVNSFIPVFVFALGFSPIWFFYLGLLSAKNGNVQGKKRAKYLFIAGCFAAFVLISLLVCSSRILFLFLAASFMPISLILFSLTAFVLILLGTMAVFSRDFGRRCPAKYYFIIGGLMIAIIVFIVLCAEILVKHGE